MLRKYSSQVIFSYDSDGAGQTAIMRGIEVLEKQNCDARVLQMEGAKDPDEFIIKYGSGRFQMLVDNAISLVEFKIKRLKDDYNLENTKDKIAFLRKITTILTGVDNKIEREIYIDKIAEQYGISKEALYGEVNKSLYKEDSEKLLTKPVSREVEKDQQEMDPIVTKRENMVLYLLINNAGETKNVIRANIGIEDLKIAENKVIYEKIMESEETDSEKLIQLIANIEDEKLQEHVSEIMVTDYEITSVEKCLEDVVLIYNKERLQNRKNQVIQELENSDLTKDKIADLESELSDIILKLAKIK